METNASSANDTRLRETLDVMAKLASGDLDARVAPSHRGDELDGVMTGLNRYFPYWESSGSMGSPNEMVAP